MRSIIKFVGALATAALLVLSPVLVSAAVADPAPLPTTPSINIVMVDRTHILLTWQGGDLADGAADDFKIRVFGYTANFSYYDEQTFTVGASGNLVVTATQDVPGARWDVYIDPMKNGVPVGQGNYVWLYLTSTVPTAPVGLSVTRLSSATGFDVTWGAVAYTGGLPIDAGYTIVTREVTDLATYITKTVSATTLSTPVIGLSAGHSYRIDVFASNDNGAGAIATQTMLLPFQAPEAPQSAILVDRGDGTVAATWTAPAYNGGRDISGYAVSFVGTDGSQFDTTVPASQTEYVRSITIPRGVSMHFDVVAVAGDLESTATRSNVQSVAATVPDLVSPVVTTSGFHDVSVTATWTAPNSGGSVITGYDLELVNVATSDVEQTVALGPLMRTYAFGGLENSTEYAVHLTATNAVGTSSSSEQSIVTNLPEPPALVWQDEVPSAAVIDVTGQSVVAHLGGVLEPGDWVFGYVYSTAIPLGWREVDALGEVTWTLPSALAAGTHHISVLDNAGATRAGTSFVISAAAAVEPARLAATGSNADLVGPCGLAVLLVGLVLVVRRRRETHG